MDEAPAPTAERPGPCILALFQQGLATTRAHPLRGEPAVELAAVLAEAASLAAEALIRLESGQKADTGHRLAERGCLTCALRAVVEHTRAASTGARFALAASLDSQRAAAGRVDCPGDGRCAAARPSGTP